MLLKQNLPLYFLLSFMILLTAGCRHQTDSRLLVSVRLMEENPDSVIAILDSIDVSSLNGDSDKALYGLLLSQAADKNYLNLSNDSIIDYSVEYYKQKGDKLKETMASYYQGRVFYHGGNNAMAIVSFFRAKELAESCREYFWAGMAYKGISDIYHDTYNVSEELTYAQREYENIKKSGKQPYLNYAILDYARALANNDFTEKALRLAQDVSDSAQMLDDRYLLRAATISRIEGLISSDRYVEALPLSAEFCNSGLAELKDSANLAIIYLKNDLYSEASRLIEEIHNSDPSTMSYVRYEIAKHNKDYETAAEELRKLDSLIHSNYKNAVKHDLTSNLADYFEMRRDVDRELLKSSRLLNIFSVTGALVILLLIVLIAIYIIKDRNKKIEEKVLFAEQLQESLRKSYQDNTLSSRIIRELLSSKYSLLENFCSIVLVNSDTNKCNHKIADAVNKLIKELTIDSTKISDLEMEIDLLQNNLMSDFRKDLPDLKDLDYRMFMFSILGMSNDTMMLLLQEEKILAIYNRKKRLKNKIKTLDQPKRERYMQYFRLSPTSPKTSMPFN